MTPLFQEISITKIQEENGSFLGFFQDFNLETQRVFFVKSSKKGIIRGRHAHKLCTQLIYVVAGEFRVSLKLSNGSTIYEKNLFASKKAILVKPKVWVELETLKSNSVFACLCDRNFEEADYIRDANNFFNIS